MLIVKFIAVHTDGFKLGSQPIKADVIDDSITLDISIIKNGDWITSLIVNSRPDLWEHIIYPYEMKFE